MVYDAEQSARNAEADRWNRVGYCLQQTRTWAGIPGGTSTAAQAWWNSQRKHYDRNIPRGGFAFWTGGSRGYGHIAMSLGNGWIRSTDAAGYGVIATRSLQWFDDNWGSTLDYVGWTDNLNGVTVPGVIDTRDGFDMADLQDLRDIAAPLDAKLDLLLQRTEGLRTAHDQIKATLDALAAEVSDDASTELVRRARDRVLAAIAAKP